MPRILISSFHCIVLNQQTYRTRIFYLLAVAFAVLFIRLGSAPVYILDEAKNAQCAREMWLRGDWIVPTFNAELRTDKPALHYWFMRLSYTLGGASPFSARFFSALAGWLLIAVTLFQTKRWAGKEIGFFSALALLLSTHYLFEFRLAVPDPYLILFTALGLFAGFSFLETHKSSFIWGAGLALGLAALAKGPVAFALPGIIFLIYILIRKKWHVFKDAHVWGAGVFALALAVPWYYLVHVKTGGAFTSGFFLDHNLNRFSAEKEGHGGPFFVTMLMVLIGMMPLSFPAILGFRKKYGFLQQPLYVFAAVVVAVYVLFFSISSTKLPNYPMPCYPFAAILCGYILCEVFEGRFRIPLPIWIIWLLLAVAIPAVGFFALRNEPDLAHLAGLALLLLVLPVGILIAFIWRNRVTISLWILAVSWVSFSAVLLWVVYPAVYRVNPVSELQRKLPKESKYIAFKAYNPAFNFNLTRDRMIIPVAKTIHELDSLEGLNRRGDLPNDSLRNVYIITRLNFLPEPEERGYREVERHKDLFELPTTVILRKTSKY